MAKARKTRRKAGKPARKTRGKRKTRVSAKTRRPPSRKTRRKTRRKGIVGKMASAMQVVADTMQETSDLREQAGKRGLIDEG